MNASKKNDTRRLLCYSDVRMRARMRQQHKASDCKHVCSMKFCEWMMGDISVLRMDDGRYQLAYETCQWT
jgi:hypothetical protein